MNERVVFFLSVSLSEFFASALFFLLLPQAPLTSRFSSAPGYALEHALPALGVWAFLVLLTLVLAPKMWRRRQNRSSKISLLVRIGILGLAIDALAGAYLWLRVPEVGPLDTGSPVPGMLMQAGIYGALFALIVAVCDQVAEWYLRRNPPSVTPPPRFGRP